MGVFYEGLEALLFGFFAFGADYPPDCSALIARWLGLEEGVGLFVGAELGFEVGGEFVFGLLEGVEISVFSFALVEGFEAGRLHSAFGY